MGAKGGDVIPLDCSKDGKGGLDNVSSGSAIAEDVARSVFLIAQTGVNPLWRGAGVGFRRVVHVAEPIPSLRATLLVGIP